MTLDETNDPIDAPTDAETREPDAETREPDAVRRPLPTASLARLYEEQGLLPLAIETWRRVLAASPGDADALAALSALGAVVRIEEPPLASTSEPSVELPVGYGVDEVVAMAVDASTLLVYWEVTAAGEARARIAGGDGETALRVVSTWLDASGAPTQETHDIVVPSAIGEMFVEGLPDGATHVCAVGAVARGLRSGFVPVAHADPVATPPD